MATGRSPKGLIEVLRLGVRILLSNRKGYDSESVMEIAEQIPDLADSKLLAAIKKITIEDNDRGKIRLSDLKSALALQKPLIEAIGKVASVNNFHSFFTCIDNLEGMSLDSFIRALRAQTIKPTNDNVGSGRTVDDYVKELKQVLHEDEAFKKVFQELKADKNMRQPEIVEIASRVAFPMAKSTKRHIALERILKQHESSLTLGAKIEAQRGQSAA